MIPVPLAIGSRDALWVKDYPSCSLIHNFTSPFSPPYSCIPSSNSLRRDPRVCWCLCSLVLNKAFICIAALSPSLRLSFVNQTSSPFLMKLKNTIKKKYMYIYTLFSTIDLFLPVCVFFFCSSSFPCFSPTHSIILKVRVLTQSDVKIIVNVLASLFDLYGSLGRR